MGALDAANKLMLMVAYGSFIAVGLLIIGIGGYYSTQVPDSSNNVAYALVGAGFGMLVVGGIAVFALLKGLWPLLSMVWFFDAALVTLLILTSVVGVILGMDVKDPTRHAVDVAFESPDFRTGHWDLGGCAALPAASGVGVNPTAMAFEYTDSNYCGFADGGFGKVAQDKIEVERNRATDPLATTEWDAERYGVRDIFRNCSVAYTGCLNDANGTGCLAQFTNDDGTPLVDDAFGLLCDACATVCAEGLIENTKSSLMPGSYVLFGTFAFVVLTLMINHWVVATKPEEGLVQLIGVASNALVTILGLVMAIVIAIGYHSVVDNCPPDADCTNAAVYIVVFLGLFMMLMGFIGIFGTKFGIHGLLSAINIIYTLCALALLVSAIFVAIVAGGMDTVNSESEKNFPELLRTYELPSMGGPYYCRQAVLDADDVPIAPADSPAGASYMMDPCFDLSGGSLGALPATCAGTSTDITGCSGNPSLSGYENPALPGHYLSGIVCDLDAATNPEAYGPGADCPIGCTIEYEACLASGGPFAAGDLPTCQPGCTPLAEGRTATCPENLLVTDRASCPEAQGCTWDPTRFAADPEQCPDAPSNRCAQYFPLSQLDCRTKIKSSIETQLTIIGWVAGAIALGVFIVMQLTWMKVGGIRGGVVWSQDELTKISGGDEGGDE